MANYGQENILFTKKITFCGLKGCKLYPFWKNMVVQVVVYKISLCSCELKIRETVPGACVLMKWKCRDFLITYLPSKNHCSVTIPSLSTWIFPKNLAVWSKIHYISEKWAVRHQAWPKNKMTSVDPKRPKMSQW